jgi:hypothetical protein
MFSLLFAFQKYPGSLSQISHFSGNLFIMVILCKCLCLTLMAQIWNKYALYKVFVWSSLALRFVVGLVTVVL